VIAVLDALQVGDDDDVGLPSFDELHGASEARTTLGRRTAPDTSRSSIVSMRVSPSRSHAARIRSACSDGETNRSLSRPPTRETRTTPMARFEEGLAIEEGKPAPDFELVSDSGETVTLSSLRGRPVVLFFYPKDDAPASIYSMA
jgi:hypothetical protein